MPDRLTDQRLAEIEACPNVADVPALLAEVRHLQTELAKSAEDVDWLRCLEAAGVDNWEGWDAAVEIRDAE